MKIFILPKKKKNKDPPPTKHPDEIGNTREALPQIRNIITSIHEIDSRSLQTELRRKHSTGLHTCKQQMQFWLEKLDFANHPDENPKIQAEALNMLKYHSNVYMVLVCLCTIIHKDHMKTFIEPGTDS